LEFGSDDDSGTVERDDTSTDRQTETRTPEYAVKRHGITFDRVLDAVDDLGLDPEGEEPIDDALDDLRVRGTLVEFPPGKYLVTETHTWEDRIDSFGFRGLGSNRRDVQFVFPRKNPYEFNFLNVRGGRHFLLENLTFQQRMNLTTTVSNIVRLEDGLQIHDVELAGFTPPDPHSHGSRLKLQISETDGVGVVRNYVSTGGGIGPKGYPTRKAQILVVTDDESTHQGELRFVDLHIENGGSHSIYATHHSGCIRVEGGLFKNNDNTNLRISGGNHPRKRSWVRGAKLVIDTEKRDLFMDGAFYENTRGFRIEAPGQREELQNHTNLLIEDCDVVCRSTPNSSGLCRVESNHGSVTLRNVRFENHVDNVPIVEAVEPNPDVVWGPKQVSLDSVQIRSTGSISESWLPRAAVTIVGRSGSKIRNSCISVSGNDMAGVLLKDATGCVIENTDLNVTGEPTLFSNAEPESIEFTEQASCPTVSTSTPTTGNESTGPADRHS
jgi:hypothetical protein